METTLVTEDGYLETSALPTVTEPWRQETDESTQAHQSLEQYTCRKDWDSVERTVYFFCDIHADADAFFLSLVASGGVLKTGPGDDDFKLTDNGKQALFIIGGDCFDKGPSTLRLLEVIHNLKHKGAELLLLAGNHDVRTYLGIFYAEFKEPLFDHLFARMGNKAIPLLLEIYERFVAPSESTQDEHRVFRNRLLPRQDWHEKFPIVADSYINPIKLKKEVRRVQEKTIQVEQLVDELGSDFGQIYAAVQKFKELFFDCAGPYYWFFESMKLGHREGSYLFVHGGLDDVTADLISSKGIDVANNEFHRSLKHDPFGLYHGPIGNIFRTKYRLSDHEFTDKGVQVLLNAGIYAIVHGHRNLTRGQRLMIRKGILNFECDASVDRNTRRLESLSGPGGAVVVFEPDGIVRALSTDYPFIKTFYPEAD